MLQQEHEVAFEAVRTAVRICRMVQAEITPGRWDKEDRTPITVADLAVQAVVSRALAEHFPDDPLMAEESTEQLRQPAWAELLETVTNHVKLVRSDCGSTSHVLDWIERGERPVDPERRYWVLDPVDGTKGFLRKEQYAIALALVERGKVLLGILACPNLPLSLAEPESPVFGQMYCAVAGGGATQVNLGPDDVPSPPVPLRVTRETDPALLTWCERVESSSRNKDVTADVVERAGVVRPPYRIDSQAKYAVVARGEAALYLRHTLDPTYREKVWDHAAGVLLMEEAGGRVTDLLGRPLDFTHGRQLSANRGIVATNGLLHDPVLAAIKELMQPVG